MHQQTALKLVSLILALSLFACGCGRSNSASSLEPREGPDYSEMVPEKDFDTAPLEQVLEDFKALAEGGGTEKELLNTYEECLNQIDILDCQATLWNIRTLKDIGDKEAEAEYEDLNARETDLCARFEAYVRTALEGSWGDALKAYIDNDEQVMYYLEAESVTDRELELQKDEDSLVNEYFDVIADFSYDDPAAGDKAAEIYLQLLDIWTEEAELEGQRSTAQYCFANYFRDYSLEDCAALYQSFAEYLIPVYNETERLLYETDAYEELEELYDLSYSEQDILDTAEPVLTGLNREAAGAFVNLTQHGMYDLEWEENKAAVGFTVSLYAYGDAFIFYNPTGGFRDLETFLHEFGHYMHNYECPIHLEEDTSNLDVDEIHSQGLELLLLPQAERLYGAGLSDTAQLTILHTMLSRVLDGCVFNEFQARAMQGRQEDTIRSANDLDSLFEDVINQYDLYYESWNADDWMLVSHSFDSPMYYISYATSALAALELWQQSRTDSGAALDIYMDIVHSSESVPFRQTLENAGLPDVFEEENAHALQSALYAWLEEYMEATGYYLDFGADSARTEEIPEAV